MGHITTGMSGVVTGIIVAGITAGIMGGATSGRMTSEATAVSMVAAGSMAVGAAMAAVVDIADRGSSFR